jgi:hypothetical protein
MRIISSFRIIATLVLSNAIFLNAISQTTPSSSTFPVNGTVDKHVVVTVLQHATVHVDENTVIEDGAVVIFRGQILSVGKTSDVSVSGPVTYLDLSGYHLYPSFVDLFSSYGLPTVKPSEWSRHTDGTKP